ncbi:MAG TPA: NAD(P)/FAD-dependent oxidoreductase [Bacilli bacterium]
MSHSNPNQNTVEIAVIGGGPAGMFAAFYGGMRQASVMLIESMPQLGGQLSALYPEKYIYDVAGFPKIKAQDLVENLEKQMKMFNIDIHLEEKAKKVIKHAERNFEIVTDKSSYFSKAVIVTAGVGAFEPRRLEVPNAANFEKKNLHYFVNDLSVFAGKTVMLTGGGDSAVDWALMLEPVAKEVILVHRRDKFRAHEHSVQLLLKSSVKIMTPYEITELHGQDKIEQVTLTHTKSKEQTQIAIDELIVNFGFISSLGPIAEWGFEIENGAIVVDSRMETSIPGIFAAGDIATYPGKLDLIAVGFGEAPTAINNAKVYFDPDAKLSPGHSSNMVLS